MAMANSVSCRSAPKLQSFGCHQLYSRPQNHNLFQHILTVHRRPALWRPSLQCNSCSHKCVAQVPNAIQRQIVCRAIESCERVSSSSEYGSPAIRRVSQWEGIKVTALVVVSLGLWVSLLCGSAFAATESIKASGIGLKIATFMRRSGWPDEAIVFLLATLPVLELRGAIPVGYWMNLQPFSITVLAILGNMVPVPFILLYLKRIANFLGKSSPGASSFLDRLFERTRKKAGPIEEFQWLGLMLFVAVPFPGTGAWTGAIAASILNMPFWEAIFANFFGVILAGLLVNLLVNLGLKYAIIVGGILFFVSTIMWSFLSYIKKPLKNSS